jgi:predicted phage terminase large subunit-like protein
VSAALPWTGGADWIADLQADVFRRLGDSQTWRTPADLALHLEPGYVVRDHLRYLSDRLAAAVARVESGRSAWVTVSMPPRTGKSTLGTVYFPTWCLHRHPGWEFMNLSHDPSLASGWGRAVRRLVEDRGEGLGVEIARDAGAAKEWETTEGGVFLSRSIRESIVGRGAKVMILDDVVKGFADAHSKAMRDFVWDWWTGDARNRLHPPSLVLAIGTRWHEDDFIGRLLSPEYDGDPAQFEVISFPAVAVDRGPDEEGPVDSLGRSPGEPLLSPIVVEDAAGALERWADIRQAVGSYQWAAQYQQDPQPASGAVFSNDWWRFWTREPLPEGAPPNLVRLPESFERVLTSWDMAFKKTDDSDYVVGQLWGASGSSRYLLRQVRRRMTFTETLAEFKRFVATCQEWVPDGVHEHLVEDKANGTAVVDVLTSEIPGVIPVNPTESKEARARSVAPTVEAGNVAVPASAEWVADFLAEHKGFPSAAHDDQVDATTQALRRLLASGPTTVLSPTGLTVARAAYTGGRQATAGRRRDYAGRGRR